MESVRRANKLPKYLALVTIVGFLASIPLTASASCSDSKVKRLSRLGKTIATIADSCDMDSEDVRDILEENNSGEPKHDYGGSPGTPLAPCGCWGPVHPNYREPNQACRSGYAVPRVCPQRCPGGGYAWQGVCG